MDENEMIDMKWAVEFAGQRYEKGKEAGRSAGRREVVEWIINQMFPLVGSLSREHMKLLNQRWKAQLKEWEIGE